MKRWLVIALLCAVTVSAASISQFPYDFTKDGKFNAFYVVGVEAPALDVVSATVISTSLARFDDIETEVGTSRTDAEIADVRQLNAIVIGSPCVNTAAATLEGNLSYCEEKLKGNRGYLKIFEHDGKLQLLITGVTDRDRKAAADFLASENLSAINTSVHEVVSNSGSVALPPPTHVPPPVVEVKPANKTEENKTVVEVKAEPEEKVEVEKKESKKSDYEPLDIDSLKKKEERGFFGSIFAAIGRFFSWIFS